MGLMQGKVALCTGAASGIGKATAELYAAEGAKVYAADISPATFDDYADPHSGGSVQYRKLDVTDEDAVAALIDDIVADNGTLDTAFNNAGILLDSLEAEWEAESFNRCLSVNVTGVMLCMKHEFRVMKSTGGTIVNTASIAGLVGLNGSLAYCASKHAVVGLTKAAALSGAPDGIRVNAVCPGPTTTPMTEASRARRGSGKAIGGVPMNRSAEPSEIADAVLWLASNRSTYVTGQAVAVDGGYVTS